MIIFVVADIFHITVNDLQYLLLEGKWACVCGPAAEHLRCLAKSAHTLDQSISKFQGDHKLPYAFSLTFIYIYWSCDENAC